MTDLHLSLEEWRELSKLTRRAGLSLQVRDQGDHAIYRAIELTHAFANSVIEHTKGGDAPNPQ